MSGNGHFDTTLDTNGFPNHADYGNAFIKLAPPSGGTLPVLDYFTMYNTATETNNDQDLASGGIMLLPDQTDGGGTTKHLAVGAGKDHLIYLLNRDGLGKFHPTDNSNAYQAFQAFAAVRREAATAWAASSARPCISTGRCIRRRQRRHQGIPFDECADADELHQNTTKFFCFPGATMAISANGTSNGILWATENSTTQGVLHAFDAANLGTELYNSSQAGTRDQYGPGSKWTVPTIANGKVFVGTQASGGTQNYVAIFGLF